MTENNDNLPPVDEAKSFAPLSQKAYVALLKAADSARFLFENLCADYEITRQQYNVLRILRGAESNGLPTLTIAERMIERAPGITKMIDRLEKKGLVYRMLCPDDRRFVYCRITKEGLEMLEKLDAPVNLANETVCSGLTDAELKQLIVLLEKLQTARVCEDEKK